MIKINHDGWIVSKTRWAGFLTFAIGSVIFILPSGKVISFLFYLAFIVSVIVLHKDQRKTCFQIYVLSIVLMLSPVDVGFRRVGHIGLRFLPVEYSLGSRQRVRELEKEGKKENVDFVVIRRQTAFSVTFYEFSIFY